MISPLPSQPIPTQRILVLDDDEIMRGVLEAMLSTQGFEVTHASGGEEALRLLRSGADFDVVLSDIHMPGLQGKVLAEALHETVTPGTVLLGMSASEPPEEVRDAFAGFLLKPFGLQLLRERIAAAKARQNVISQELIAAEASLPVGGEVLDANIFGSLLRVIPAAQLAQLFTMALKDIEKRHGRILLAAREDDLPTAQSEAHAIKGACGMIGATELQALAAAIETGANFNQSAIREIPEACLRLQRVLESKL